MRAAIIKRGHVENVIDVEPGQLDAFKAVECPDDCGPGWTYRSGKWAAPVVEEPQPTVDDVKTHAAMLINQVMPVWRQVNALRNQHIAKLDGSEEFERIDAIRAASNRLESMKKIPLNFRDDDFWK